MFYVFFVLAPRGAVKVVVEATSQSLVGRLSKESS